MLLARGGERATNRFIAGMGGLVRLERSEPSAENAVADKPLVLVRLTAVLGRIRRFQAQEGEGAVS